jgi:lauroyl/myristoyl acyltransferase
MTDYPMRESCILLACRFFRALERVLPVPVISLLCWPVAAAQAACQLTFVTPTVRQFDRLPRALRPPLSRAAWVAYLWRECTRINLARLLCLWPERLCRGRWAERCRSVGLERLKQAQASGRPVALAFLHFGPMILLCHWLRAQNLPAAALRTRPSAERPLYWKYIDRLSAPSHAPDLQSVIGRAELRRAKAHLRAGRILAITVEGRHERHLRLVRDGFAFDMATGILRLAAATGAVVMPCLLTAGPRMSFTAHFGDPVPDELVVDTNRHPAACEHLLREFLAVVGRHPGQSHVVLIEHLEPVVCGGPSSAAARAERAF